MTMTLNGSGTGTVGVPNSGTAQNSTSGTSIEFTGIPAGIKRITVMFNSVSGNSTGSYLQVQLGTSSGYTISGYQCYTATMGTSSVSGASVTTGFAFRLGSSPASASISGSTILTNLSGNIWTEQGLVTDSSAGNGLPSSGSITMGGTVDRVRVIISSTGSPADTFDAGSINILYE